LIETETIYKGATFLQATLNSINGLVGVGLLAFPFAFRMGGWIGGGVVLVVLCAVTCYTARILGKCIESQEDLYTFTDIGNAAFGPKMELFVGMVIFMELFTSLSSYIILEADNLSHVLPGVMTHLQWMLVVTIVILPTTWIRDLTKLSYFSIVGIMASVFLFLSVIYIAVFQHHLVHPAPTVMLNLKGVPVSMGLIMVSHSHSS
jgi:vesicular inhibitory amino acid transporter